MCECAICIITQTHTHIRYSQYTDRSLVSRAVGVCHASHTSSCHVSFRASYHSRLSLSLVGVHSSTACLTVMLMMMRRNSWIVVLASCAAMVLLLEWPAVDGKPIVTIKNIDDLESVVAEGKWLVTLYVPLQPLARSTPPRSRLTMR